jgi:hypothetical protein
MTAGATHTTPADRDIRRESLDVRELRRLDYEGSYGAALRPRLDATEPIMTWLFQWDGC